MGTFLEFYEVLLKFVNFKLYSGSNLLYPPKLDITIENTQYHSYKSFLL